MARSIFGWDLPPGCSMRDIDDAWGDEGPEDAPEDDRWPLEGMDDNIMSSDEEYCPQCGAPCDEIGAPPGMRDLACSVCEWREAVFTREE